MTTLTIKNLHATIDGKQILKGINLDVHDHEIHAIMGPNGSGKSTLANVLMGHPDYQMTDGEILFDGTSLHDLSPDERSKLGLFLSFQYPVSVPGVQVSNFLRTALNAHRESRNEPALSVIEFNNMIEQKLTLFGMNKDFLRRYLNEGFSGGEKKRMEMLQLALLSPKIAILDETDSGTDVDALRIIAEGIKTLRQISPVGMLLITHYERVLHLLNPDRVSILVNGRIVETGGRDLANYIENNGYKKYLS